MFKPSHNFYHQTENYHQQYFFIIFMYPLTWFQMLLVQFLLLFSQIFAKNSKLISSRFFLIFLLSALYLNNAWHKNYYFIMIQFLPFVDLILQRSAFLMDFLLSLKSVLLCWFLNEAGSYISITERKVTVVSLPSIVQCFGFMSS